MNFQHSVSETAAEWVNRRAAGLTSTEETELAAWLAADPRHRDAFDRSNRVWSLMDRPHETGCADTIVHQLAERRRKRARRRVVTAGAGTVAFLAMLMVAQHLSRAVPEPPTLPKTASLAEVRRQTLPDGSLVEFKADAQVEVQLVSHERRVRMVRGEAHFDVKSDPERPFIVVANGVEVRAVGTAFAVRIDEQAVDVLVTEGRVAVARQSPENGIVASRGSEDEGPGKQGAGIKRPERRGQSPNVGGQRSVEASHLDTPAPVYVTAGRRAVVSTIKSSAGVHVTEVTSVEQERSLAWRYPRLEFSGTRLTEAVELFNGHATGRHPIRLRVGDPELGDLEVSGFFRTDNVEGFVRLMEDSFGVRADRSSGHEIVLRHAR